MTRTLIVLAFTVGCSSLPPITRTIAIEVNETVLHLQCVDIDSETCLYRDPCTGEEFPAGIGDASPPDDPVILFSAECY